MLLRSPQTTVRLAAITVLVVAGAAIGLATRAARQQDTDPVSARPNRPAVRSTPATIPHSAGTGYPEGAVALSQDAPKPPVGNRPRLTAPLDSWSDIVDRFGSPRGTALIHGGVDFGFRVRAGTLVYPACAGTVAFSGLNDSYGTHLIIDCGAGWSTVYAYLGEAYAGAGEPVSEDAPLGLSDPDGRPLHFEVRWQNTPQDPEVYLDLSTPRPQPRESPATATPRSSRSAGGQPTPSAEAATSTPTSRPTATPTRLATPTPIDRR